MDYTGTLHGSGVLKGTGALAGVTEDISQTDVVTANLTISGNTFTGTEDQVITTTIVLNFPGLPSSTSSSTSDTGPQQISGSVKTPTTTTESAGGATDSTTWKFSSDLSTINVTGTTSYDNSGISGSFSLDGTLLAPALPDLTFTSFSLNASSLAVNGNIDVNYVIANKGSGDAPASEIGLYYSTSSTFSKSSATELFDFSTGTHAAMSSGGEGISFNLNYLIPPGTYHLFLVANDTDAFTESNANNNVTSGAILKITAPALFTTGLDQIDFNSLDSGEKDAIIANPISKYDGLGGSDTVTLPTEANETQNIGDGETLGWQDSVSSLFHTHSRVGDTYTVNGSDGDYYIDCGAGTDIINIVNPNLTSHTSYNTIITGSGNDQVTINGANGDNLITVGTGSPTINLNGYGNNKVQVQGADPPTVFGDIVTSANPEFANNGSFTFSFLLDATDTFGGTLSGDGAFYVQFGTLIMHGGESFTGDVGIMSATLELTSYNAVGSGPITFLPNAGQLSGTLQIDGATMPSNVIFGFTPDTNTTIDLRSVSYTGQGIAKLLANNVLDVVQNANDNGSANYSLNLDPSFDFSPYHFALSDDGMGGTKITLAPTVTGVDTTSKENDIGTGGTATITLDLGEAIKVTGTPTLALSDGETATYLAASSKLTSGMLAFSYKATANHTSADLQINSIVLGKGVAVTDLAGNPADFTITSGQANLGLTVDTVPPIVTGVTSTTASGSKVPLGGSIEIDLTTSEAVAVIGAPTLTLSDGGTATYDAAESNLATGKIAFEYITKATQNTADLKVTALNQPSGASIKDLAGNAINPAGAVNKDLGITIDTNAPKVTAVAHTLLTGDITNGQHVTITLTVKDATAGDTLSVTGAPTLLLNDGGTATLTGHTNTSLTFDYAVGNESTTDLKITGLDVTNGTITDAAGNPIAAIAKNLLDLKLATNVFTWAHAISGDWNTVADWTPTAVPSTGNTALITAAGNSYTVTVAQDNSIGVLKTAKTATLVVVDDMTLQVGGSVSNAGTIDVNNGGLTINGIVTNTGLLSVAGGSSSVISGGVTNAGTIGVSNGDLTINGTVTNTGLLSVAGGSKFDSTGAVTGAGTATITADGMLEFGVASTESVNFNSGATGTLKLGNKYSGTLNGFAPGDFIDLPYIAYNQSTVAIYSYNASNTGGILLVSGFGGVADIALRGQYGNNFVVGSDGQGGTLVAYSIDPVHWINSSGGKWTTPANWSTGAVPAPSYDVAIDASGTYTVISSTTTHIDTLRTVAGATLSIAGASSFALLEGTGPEGNAGTIAIADGGTLSSGGSIVNSGTISLNSSSAAHYTSLVINNANATLSGGGTVKLSDFSPFSGGNRISGGFAGVNVTIAGAVTMGSDVSLSFTNTGVDGLSSPLAVDDKVMSGSTTASIAAALANAIDTNAMLNAADIHGTAAGSTIFISEPDSIGNATIVGSTVSAHAAETVNFSAIGGSAQATGQLEGGGTYMLTNVDNTISGAGTIGAFNSLIFVNEGTVAATGSNQLTINTGTNAIVNSGTMVNEGSNFLVFLSTIDNSGVIESKTGAGVFFSANGVSLNNNVTGQVIVDDGEQITFQSGLNASPAFTATNITVNNSGMIELNSTGGQTVLGLHAAGVTLQGGGTIELSDSTGNHIWGAEAVVFATLGGTATAGDVLTATFTNSILGLSETLHYTVQNGDTPHSIAENLQSAINADVTLQNDHITSNNVNGTEVSIIEPGTVANSTVVALAVSSGAHTETVSFSDPYIPAQLTTDGHLGGGSADVLTNVDNTIEGSGFIGTGDTNMTLINDGVIEATGSNQALDINTGANTVINGATGLLYNHGAMRLEIDSTVRNLGVVLSDNADGSVSFLGGLTNNGTLEANNGHINVLNGSVTGTGTAQIDGSTGQIEFAGASSNNVIFGSSATAGGGLFLDTATDTSNKFTGTVAGFAHGEFIELDAFNIATARVNSYTTNAAGGVLQVTDGAHTESLTFVGNYAITDFTINTGSGHVDLLHV